MGSHFPKHCQLKLLDDNTKLLKENETLIFSVIVLIKS